MKYYPDKGLSEPVRDLSECFSGIKMLRDEMEKNMKMKSDSLVSEIEKNKESE